MRVAVSSLPVCLAVNGRNENQSAQSSETLKRVGEHPLNHCLFCTPLRGFALSLHFVLASLNLSCMCGTPFALGMWSIPTIQAALFSHRHQSRRVARQTIRKQGNLHAANWSFVLGPPCDTSPAIQALRYKPCEEDEWADFLKRLWTLYLQRFLKYYSQSVCVSLCLTVR